MRTILFTLLLSVTFPSFTQSPFNSLNFDGVDDYVSAPLPSLFNGLSANDFTIETWVKVEGTGVRRLFFGSSASGAFASILISSSNKIFCYVETAVTDYSQATASALPTSNWTHLAFTWQASTQVISIYFNGVLQASFNGGSSSSPSVLNSITIGRAYSTSYFQGELDEFRIWDIARTQCEIVGTMNSEFSINPTGLVTYYNFNEGVAGGSNPGVINLPDQAGTNNGVLNNFSLSGSSSNWLSSMANVNDVNAIPGVPTSGTDVQTECDNYTWIDGNTYTSSNNTATWTLTNAAGCDSVVTLDLTITNSNTGTDVQTACDSYTWIDGNTYTASNNSATWTLTNASGCDSVVTLDLTINNSNTSTDFQTACDSYTWIDGNTYTASNNSATWTLTNAAGCDSVVTLDLTINNVSDITTAVNGITISANNSNATYAWLDCDNNYAVINGETNASYTPTANGNYAVELTENGCVDTSACVAITTVGIIENTFNEDFTLYPNPTDGLFSIEFKSTHEIITLKIVDASGKLIDSKNYNQIDLIEYELNERNGIYLIEVSDGREQRSLIRLIKQ